MGLDGGLVTVWYLRGVDHGGTWSRWEGGVWTIL